MKNVFPCRVTDISFDSCAKVTLKKKSSHQIGFLKKQRFNARDANRDCFETSHKNVQAPNVRGARTFDPEIKSLMLYRLS